MIYFLVVISFFVSLVLNYFLRKVGEKYGFYDQPYIGPLKIHKKPISYLGGLAIFLATVFLFFINKSFNFQIWGILFGGFLTFIPGFWDDLKWKKEGVKPLKKLFFLVLFSLLVSVILINSEIKINFLPGKIIIFLLTFFYVSGLINAVNFEDGIDGLAGGLAAISLIGFIILSIILGNNLGLVISLILLGAVLGFLVFNFPPAKIFMGDSGAYFLGFVLSILAMLFSLPFNFKSLIGPIFIIGLPIFDTAFVILDRIFQRKSIFIGGRRHFYDRIIQRGFSTRKTILISYFFQLILVILGIIIYIYV